MKVRVIPIAVIVALLAVPARADDTALRAALKADLTRYLAARAKPEHISALSLSVSLKNEPDALNVTAGTTQYGGGIPVTPANLYQIGSNTKAFTAVTILQLEAEGKLGIEQTVGRWLPQYRAWKDVSIKQLLNMTSPIPTYDDVPAIVQEWVKNPNRVFTTSELVKSVYPDHPDAPKPTTGWSYSNTNYLLAEMIIEKVTGHSYTTELEQRFLSDPDLSNTFYAPSTYPPEVVARMVSGYFWNDDLENAPLRPFLGRDVRDDSLSWAQGAGGMVATPQDVASWSRRLYVGDLLAPKQRAELTSIVSTRTGKPIGVTSASDSRGFGLGVGQMTEPGFGTIWFYQGTTLGYRMIYAYFPKADAVIAFGLNSQTTDKESHAGQLMASIYQTLHEAGKI